MAAKGLVSDRARALVKLGKAAYLGVGSSADLFHFTQDLGRAAGCKIGLSCARKQKQLNKEGLSSEERQELAAQLEGLQAKKEQYRQQIEQINKAVHPFGEGDQLQKPAEVEKRLTHSFSAIGKLAKGLGIDIPTATGAKILAQIPDIAAGVGRWQQWAEEEINEQAAGQSPQYRAWLEKAVLPYAYWQAHLGKVPTRKRDGPLRQYYKGRAAQARQRFEQHRLTRQMEESLKEPAVNWAFQMAAAFQRSSSQVEGRNGYLAFVHHAHKGIPPQRRKVLTVVHNFDTRRQDGLAPAQRLFKTDFPDLFEFILENVTGFPPPRARLANVKWHGACASSGQC